MEIRIRTKLTRVGNFETSDIICRKATTEMSKVSISLFSRLVSGAGSKHRLFPVGRLLFVHISSAFFLLSKFQSSIRKIQHQRTLPQSGQNHLKLYFHHLIFFLFHFHFFFFRVSCTFQQRDLIERCKKQFIQKS